MNFQTRSNTDFFQSSFIIYYNYSAGAIPQGAFAKELNSCYLFSKKARISFSEACIFLKTEIQENERRYLRRKDHGR